MKRNYSLLFAVLFTATALQAQVFIENFSGHTISGNLEGTNGWVQGEPTASESPRLKGESPIIESVSLSYPNYVASGSGNVAVIDTGSVARKSMKALTYNGSAVLPVSGEKVYLAAMVNFTAFDTISTYREVFNFNKENATTDRGRIYAKVEDDMQTVTVSFSKGSNTDRNESTSLTGLNLSINKTILFVLVQSTVSGSSNDENILYINPDLSKSEQEQANVLLSPSNTAQSDYGTTNALYVALRQNGAGYKIGGIVATKSWSELFLLSGVGQVAYNDGSIRTSGRTILTDHAGTLKIYNASGHELKSVYTNGVHEFQHDKGFFLVKFIADSGQVSSTKVILN